MRGTLGSVGLILAALPATLAAQAPAAPGQPAPTAAPTPSPTAAPSLGRRPAPVLPPLPKPAAAYSESEIKALIDGNQRPLAEAVLRGRLAGYQAANRIETILAAVDGEALTLILMTSNRAAEAEPVMRAALRVREQAGEAIPLGRALNRMATVLVEMGRFDEAEALARRTIDVLAAQPASDDRLIAGWANLGRSLEGQDRLPEAIETYGRGIAVGTEKFGANHPIVATVAELRTAAQGRVVRYAARTAEQRRKVETTIQAKGRSSAEAAHELYLLSLYLKAEGKFAEAETVAQDAYDLHVATLGPANADTRSALYQLATMLRRNAAARAAGDPRGGAVPPGVVAPPVIPAKVPEAYSEEEIRAIIDAGRLADAERITRARVARHGAAETAAAASDMELLANVLYLTGGATEAETLMRRTIGIRERVGDRKALATTLRRLALVLSLRGDPAAAEPIARRAITQTAALPGETRALAAAWGTLGEILAEQRRRPEASAAMQKAIEYSRQALGDNDPIVVEDYNGYALNLEEMGNLAEAEAIYRRNLQRIEQARGRGSLESARTLALLSNNLNRQQKDLEAEVRLRQAIAIREARLGVGNPDTLRSLGNLVGLLTSNGKYDDAAALQARVMRLRAALPDASAEEQVGDLGRMGSILAKQGKADDAIAYQRRALALAKERLDPGHRYVAIATMDLAKSLAGRAPQSDEYVTLMRGAVERARDERARLLAGGGRARGPSASAGDRAIATALSDDNWSDAVGADVFALAMSLNANRATRVRGEEARLRAESFLIAQDSTSSAATRALAGVRAREALGDTPLARLVRRQQDLAAEVRAKDRALITAMTGPAETVQRLRGEIAVSGQALADVSAQLRRAYPDYARLVAPEPLSEAEVRRRLRPGEAVLLVTQGDQFDFTYVVTKKAAGWYAVPRLQSFLTGTIEAFRCEVDPETCSGIWTASPVFKRSYAWDLYRFLVKPHEELLKDVNTLYVTTSGPLSDLPFAAFITEEPQGADTEAALAATPWLADRFAIVNLPSVATLRAGAARPARPNAAPFVGYGAPRLAEAGTNRAVTSTLAPAVVRGERVLADPDRLRALPSLPGTEVELNAMARVLNADASTIHLGVDATEAAVRANPALADARIIAFATHGVLPGEMEGFAEPGLIFTPPARASLADDGILTASEAAALRLSAEWVILSACNTGTTEGPGGGDALSALAQAFLYAGADALLASRWRVGDTVTAALTVETLANAERNPRAGRAAAFQAAMRAIRTGKRADGSAVAGWTSEWSHPASWAPFTLIANAN